MPENNKVSKQEFNRKVAKAVLAHFRAADGKMVVTAETIVAKLHEALVALGAPINYRVCLDLLKSFGFASETLGLAYFADAMHKLDKVVGTIVDNTLVSIEANTAAQKAAVLLLLTQNADAYRKACVSAKEAAELLNDALDLSPTPQQTPQQADEAEKADEPAKADEAAKGDTPMETEEGDTPTVTEEGDAPTDATMTEPDLGELKLNEIGKLPPLPEEVHEDVASPQAQRIVPGDDTAQTEGEQGDATPQAPAQAPAQAERAATKRPRQTGGYQAKSKRKKQRMSTFFVVGGRKTSKSAAAQKRRDDAKEKLKRSAKFKLIGRVPNDAAQQLPAAERTVEPVEAGYILAPVQSLDYLFKYAIRDTTTGDAVIRFFDKDRLFARKLRGGKLFWPHIGLVTACMAPGKWCKSVADGNYCYYPTADEVNATVAVYGAAFNVLAHSSAAAAPRSDSGSSSGSGSDSGDDSGNDSGNDE